MIPQAPDVTVIARDLIERFGLTDEDLTLRQSDVRGRRNAMILALRNLTRASERTIATALGLGRGLVQASIVDAYAGRRRQDPVASWGERIEQQVRDEWARV